MVSIKNKKFTVSRQAFKICLNILSFYWIASQRSSLNDNLNGELSFWPTNDNFDLNRMNLKQQSVLSKILRNISGHSILS